MVFERIFLDEFSEKARVNPRLRQNYDLRNGTEDKSQRMLNAIEPGSVLPVHRHRQTSETVVIVRGSLIEIFYDDNGDEIGRFVLDSKGDLRILQVPAGCWHKSVALEPGTIIFEAKDGPYAPVDAQDIMKEK